MKKIKDYIVVHIVEFMVIFNIFGVIWFISTTEGSIEKLVTRFVVLTIAWALILLMIFVPRRLYRRSRLRRKIYIKIMRKYPEIFYIEYWYFVKADLVKYFGHVYIGYFVWRFLKYVLVGTKIRWLKPYRWFWNIREIIMLMLYELYLGIIYMILIVFCKIDEVLLFFDTKPVKTIIKSRVVAYLATMVTFLIWGSSLLKYLIIVLLFVVYMSRFINIMFGFFANRREQLESDMEREKGDMMRWLKNSFTMNGFNYFPIKSKYEQASKKMALRHKEIPKALLLWKKISWFMRLKRKYNLEWGPPTRLLHSGKREKRTKRRLDPRIEEDRVFAISYPELCEWYYEFEFLIVHEERRKYSDIEHWLVTNNVEFWTTILQRVRSYDDFRLVFVSGYLFYYYKEPTMIWWKYYNIKMEKPSFEGSWGDLKWMSEKYFEFKDLKPFLFRFYEIIEDDKLRNEFIEVAKECYYYFSYMNMNDEEATEYKRSLSREEKIRLREKQLELLEKFGL